MKISRREEFWFALLRKEDLQKLWNPELEIIFMLKGMGQIYFEDMKTAYSVRETDIFVINSFEMHNLELEEDAVALSFSVSLEFITSVSPEILKNKVDCRSFLYAESKQESFDVLRRDLARAFQNQYKNEKDSAPYPKSKAAAVLEDLSQYFLDMEHPAQNKGSRELLKTAVNYIQYNYKENITLEDLANQTFLSKTYISRSFTKSLGISFTEYLTMVRLSHAIGLMNGTDTLAEIAYESGFPNVNAMIQAFKKYRGITPGEYRKNLESVDEPGRIGGQDTVAEKDVFSSLMEYAAKPGRSEFLAEKVKEIVVNPKGRTRKIMPHWRRVINAGYARSITDGSIQREIRYLQERIGFEYIRVKGILDDDMCLLREDMNGNTIINYTYIDEVMDFILSAGAKPMIELGYMPQILAKETGSRSMRNGIISAPKDIEQWQTLVKSLMEHLAQRYGMENVRKWMFAPWVSVDFIDFGLCSSKEYEEIYFASYHAIKSVNPNFLITGPGCADGRRHLGWFLEMCRRRGCMPDIMTFRSYAAAGMEREEKGLKLIGNNESFPMAVSADEDFLQNTVKEIRGILQKEGLDTVPLVLEEWSNSIWQRDLCNDTCYKSAYLFKNILENNQSLNAMGYFTLNDRIDEVPPTESTFHGGFGLFTKNDIPKSACRALELLGQMGDRLIQRGEGYFITRGEHEIQIFLYNYCHYDLLYRYRHVVNMSSTSRYQVFVPKESQAFFIQVRDIEAGKYEIRRYGITREGGSSYDAWVRMGAPETLDHEEREILRNLSHPLYRREHAEVKSGENVLNIKASLNPLDIWLIKINIS